MLEFRKPEISDKQWVDECFSKVKSVNCEYAFGNCYVWNTIYSTLICRYNDFFICRWGRGDEIMYSLPIGEGDFADAVNAIIEDAKSLGVTPSIYGVTEEYENKLNLLFPDKFTFEYDDGNYDYIYSVENLAALSGKKYHSKRNHITNFKKNNPDWSFEVIDENNIGECIELHSQWINSREDDSDYSFEFEAVLTAIENFEALGFVGGLIRVSGKPIAFTFGERRNDDVFITHFEKAPADIQGAYAIINQEFAKNCLSGYKYVNREEDLGIEGLRKAKQSYKPEFLLKKSIAVLRDKND